MGLYVSKVTAAGQISIPRGLREDLGFKEADYVSMEPRGGSIMIRKIRPLSDQFAYFQAEAKKKGITREDVNTAIRGVRKGLMKERYGIE